MKIKINENKKEDMPVSYMADFISRGWQTVGMLQTDVEQLGKTFNKASKTVEIIQDLIDAYLISLGQMQELIGKQTKLDFPPEAKLTAEKSEEKKSIQEDLILINPEIHLDVEPEIPATVVTKKTIEKPIEEFEYSCDFPEPDLTSGPPMDFEELMRKQEQAVLAEQ